MADTVSLRSFISTVGDARDKPPIGYSTAFIHLVKAYIGTGIFALGEAFKNGGLVAGPVGFVIIALMNLNCQHMIINAGLKVAELEPEDVKPSFAETVQYTLESSSNKWLRNHSRKMGFMTNIFVCITELGFCCVYFVFIADHMLEITAPYGFLDTCHIESKHIMLAIILAPMWISTLLGSLKTLLPLSLMANILMWSGIAIVLMFIFKSDFWDIEKLSFISSIEKLPMFFGTALFSFEAITLIIPLRNEMENPKHFIMACGVLNVGMAFVCSLFVSFGFLSYWKFGDTIESSVFLNLPKDHILSYVAKILICIGVLFTFTLHMYVPFEITFPLFYRSYGPFKYKRVIKYLYKSVPVLMTYFLANVVPFLGLFISLVGSSTGSFLALIIPPILDIVVLQDKISAFTFIKNVIICSVGIIGAITGTAVSLYEIIEQLKIQYWITDNSTNQTCTIE